MTVQTTSKTGDIISDSIESNMLYPGNKKDLEVRPTVQMDRIVVSFIVILVFIALLVDMTLDSLCYSVWASIAKKHNL